jgi:hypothetical protein
MTRRETFEDAGWNMDTTWFITGDGTGVPQIIIEGNPFFTITYQVDGGGHLSLYGAMDNETTVTMTLARGATGIEVTAIPDDGYVFIGWDNGDTSTVRYDVADGDSTITAIFESVDVTVYTLTYQAGIGGYLNTAGTMTVARTVVSGERSVAVTAVPNAGYRFVEWDDGVIDNPRSDIATGDLTFMAMFEIISEDTPVDTLTYQAGIGGYLSIGGSRVDDDLAMTLERGEQGVEITAVPDDGFVFDRWSDGVTDNPRFDIASRNLTITAIFARDGPIMIHDFDDLLMIGKVPTHPLDGYYALANNIDASPSREMNEGMGFEPIGRLIYDDNWNAIEDTKFTGTFDGRGYVIHDLYINRPNDQRVGLFGQLGEYLGVSGVVRGLGLENVEIIGHYNVGSLAGYAFSTITDCYSTGIITGMADEEQYGGEYIGGLVGIGDGTITNSYFTGEVSGRVRVGGLVGRYSSGSIINSYSTGTVIGGIDMVVLLSVNEGVGGLVGVINGSVTIEKSYSTATVTGAAYVGGLVGSNFLGAIRNSYATGTVSSTATDRVGFSGEGDVGGLVGVSAGGAMYGHPPSTIRNSYATGTVNKSGSPGTSNGQPIWMGGLLGNARGVEITDSYWNTETSGHTSNQIASIAGEGRTTAEMTTQTTFTDWDFGEVWAIDPTGIINNGYPYLRDNPPPPNPNPAPTPAPPLAKSQATHFSVGPNPVGSGDVINFFWDGDEIISGTFSIYSASGVLVNTINIGDVDNTGINKSRSSLSPDNLKRRIGSWSITDRRSRRVPSGTYLVRGVITTVDGRRERVSVVVGVR